jgi:ferric-dicitrate binding protein FerR (iron transport regulator)
MDLNYNQPEDFAADESFINYCLGQDAGDARFWEQWLEANPAKRKAAAAARELVFLMGVHISPQDRQAQWEKMHISTAEDPEVHPALSSSVRRKTRKVSFAAAGMLILLAAGVLLWRYRPAPAAKTSVASAVTSYQTQAGQRQKILLADGTTVWLNADSRLSCDSGFTGGGRRVVTLSGEAYFEVAHEAARPFIIHARELDIKVLGTVFNVKAYPGDHTAEAALIQGSIQVSLHQHPSRKLILRPHEKITVFNGRGERMEVDNTGGTVKKANPSADTVTGFAVAPLTTDPLLDSGTVETAWMEGKLVFRDESFAELAAQMERRYGVRFRFTAGRQKAYRFTGIFSTETVQQALTALQLTTPSDPFTFKVEGDQVFISPGLKTKQR